MTDVPLVHAAVKAMVALDLVLKNPTLDWTDELRPAYEALRAALNLEPTS